MEGEQLGPLLGNGADTPLPPQAEEAARAQLLERVRAHPIELNMSFAQEGTALIAQFDEGIYRYSAIAEALLPAEENSRRMLYNVMSVSDRIVPLKDGEVYVKPVPEKPGMAPHECAEVILDRIAELSKATPGAYLDDIIDLVRKESSLLRFADAVLIENLCRRSLRLLTRHEMTGQNTKGPTQIDSVLDAIPTPAATVGESIDRLVAETSPGMVRTASQWVRKVRGRLLYTSSTVYAFHRAIELDPRFILTRQHDSSGTSAYSLGLAEGQLPPLPTKGDIYRTPMRELVERAIGLCATWDLRMKADLPTLVAQGKDLSERTRRLMIQAVMEDPRVSAIDNSPFIRILHTPEDAHKYEELAGIVDGAIKTLLNEGPRLLSFPQLTEYMRAAAMREGVELTKHVRHMLHALVEIDPRVGWSRGDQKMKVSVPAPVSVTPPKSPKKGKATPAKTGKTPAPGVRGAAPRQVASKQSPRATQRSSLPQAPAEQSPQLDTPAEISREEAIAQAAVRSVELMRLLGRERVTELQEVAQIAIRRRIDGATTVLVEGLMNLAEGLLVQRNENTSLTAEEREYLEGVFAHDERLEPIENRDGVLRVRAAEGQTGVIRGVEVDNLSHFNTTYGRKR